jgi:hypothetical protein
MKTLNMVGSVLILGSFGLVACGSDSSDDPPQNQAGSSGTGATHSGGTTHQAGATSKGGGAGQSSGGSAGRGGAGQHSGGSAGNGSGGNTSAGAGGTAGTSSGGSAGVGSPDVSSCLKDAAVQGSASTEVLTFKGTDVTLGLVRFIDQDKIGTSGSRFWIAERFALTRNQESYCNKVQSELSWKNTYHNFNDSLSVSQGEQTLLFTWNREDYDQPIGFAVQAKKGAEVLWGPLALTLTKCVDLLRDEDCTAHYARP